MDKNKFVNPIDINQIQSSVSVPGRSNSVPTVIIKTQNGHGDGDDEGSYNKVRLLEKVVRVQVLFNILLIMLLAVTVYVTMVLRVDILKFFNKNVSPPVSYDSNKQVQSTAALGFKVVAAESELTPVVYINKQGVDIDKVFQESSTSARLTAFGRLKNEVLGFLPYWFVPVIDKIDTKTVTSISFFGLEVDGLGNIIKQDLSGNQIGAWSFLQKDEKLKSFLNKARQNRIKVYVTLKCFNQDNIISLLTSEKARQNFINNALFLMNSENLDGLNIDFEYIGTPESKVRDGFSALIIDLNKAMKKEHQNSVLTIDTFVDAASASRIHDISVLAQNSDGLVIMGYDFSTPNSSRPGPLAPFEGAGLSIKGLMASYLDKAPAEKLILGVPYYGYDWPVKKTGSFFEVTGGNQQVRILPYGEIAESLRNSRTLWDESAQSPWYSYQDTVTGQTRVVYFENVRSLSVKYDFVKKSNMQGIAIWALGFDGTRTDLSQTIVNKFAQ